LQVLFSGGLLLSSVLIELSLQAAVVAAAVFDDDDDATTLVAIWAVANSFRRNDTAVSTKFTIIFKKS
jgi:hypothetical protein